MAKKPQASFLVGFVTIGTADGLPLSVCKYCYFLTRILFVSSSLQRVALAKYLFFVVGNSYKVQAV